MSMKRGALGAGITGGVNALCVFQGELWIAGTFTNAGGDSKRTDDTHGDTSRVIDLRWGVQARRVSLAERTDRFHKSPLKKISKGGTLSQRDPHENRFQKSQV